MVSGYTYHKPTPPKPVCDAECQALKWLHVLTNDSGQGRSDERATTSNGAITASHTGATSAGVITATAGNGNGPAGQSACESAVQAAAGGQNSSIADIADQCFGGDSCLSDPIPDSNPNAQTGGWDWYAPQGSGSRAEGAIGCASTQNSGDRNDAKPGYAGEGSAQAFAAGMRAVGYDAKRTTINGCHLLPSVLGGNGNPENISACWRYTNVGPGGMRRFEFQAQRALRPATAVVGYLAFPSYNTPGNHIPSGFYLAYVAWNGGSLSGGASTYIANTANGTLPNLAAAG